MEQDGERRLAVAAARPGGATPVVWGDQIFLTSSKSGGDLLLISVSTAGKKLWEVQVSGGDRTVRGDKGNSASPSPVTDGKHVWAFMANGVLGCYDFQGREVWKFNLQDRYGPFAIQFGMTSSPLLDGDRLYMQLLHSKAALVLASIKTRARRFGLKTGPATPGPNASTRMPRRCCTVTASRPSC